ncbi:unnamed protein product, partial [Prorocentrum cordatum]
AGSAALPRAPELPGLRARADERGVPVRLLLLGRRGPSRVPAGAPGAPQRRGVLRR